MTAILLPLAANLGIKSLYLLLGWLGSTILCEEMATRKGYDLRWGLASGMLLTVIGVVIWIFVPAKAGSSWKVDGPLGKRSRPT